MCSSSTMAGPRVRSKFRRYRRAQAVTVDRVWNTLSPATKRLIVLSLILASLPYCALVLKLIVLEAWWGALLAAIASGWLAYSVGTLLCTHLSCMMLEAGLDLAKQELVAEHSTQRGKGERRPPLPTPA